MVDSFSRSGLEKSTYTLVSFNPAAGTGYCHSSSDWFRFDVKTGRIDVIDRQTFFTEQDDPFLVPANLQFNCSTDLLAHVETEHLLHNKFTSYKLLFTARNLNDSMRRIILKFLDRPEFCHIQLLEQHVKVIKSAVRNNPLLVRLVIDQVAVIQLSNVKKCLSEELHILESDYYL
ncbi:MAG: hypothetical protein ACFFD4_29650 [Candidatus Odinarchaeota archaeon]